MKWAISLLAVAFLANCARVPQRTYPDLGANIPQGWTEEALSGDVRMGWVTHFEDERLNQMVLEALSKNHDLKAAVARLDRALADTAIAGADLYPQVDLSIAANKAQALSRTTSGADSFDGYLRSRSTAIGISLDVAWELDVWGRIRSGKEASLADMQAAKADVDSARLSLVGQTCKAWFATAEARMQLKLAQETLSSFEKTGQLVQSRFEKGLNQALDVHLSRTDTASARALVEQNSILLKQQVRDLEVILGRYPSAEIEVMDALKAVPPKIPVGVPSDLLQRRPDIIAAERRVAGGEKRVNQARAARFPRFSLTGSVGTSTDKLIDIVDPKQNVWNLGMNLLTPLIDGGRLAADVRRQKASTREDVANYGSTVLNAFREVEQALTQERLLAIREASLQVSADEAKLAVNRAQDRYSRGLLDLLTVLETQRRALDAERSLIEVRRQRLDNRVDLHLALGGQFAGNNATVKGGQS